MKKPKRLKKNATPAQVAAKRVQIERYKKYQKAKADAQKINDQLSRL